MNKFIRTAASLKVTVLCLILLSIQVVWGTFYQIEHGILAAQREMFHSWALFLFGIIPFPGVKTVLVILSVNLAATGFKTFLRGLKRAGLALAHIGTATLLLGAGLSSFTTQESLLSLFEGEKSSTAINFADWELALSVRNKTGITGSGTLDISKVRSSAKITFPGTGVHLMVHRIHSNCTAFGYSSQSVDSLLPKPPSDNRGSDIPGMIVTVTRNGTPHPKKTVLYGGSGMPSTIVIGSDTLLFSLQPRQTRMPVQIELISFSKLDHPGTSNAKSFQSRIRVTGPDLNREAIISMNRPFRYRSWTLYQTGYSENDGHLLSSFSVVQNPVRYAPYVAGVIIMIGLMLHFLIVFTTYISASRR